jgi:plastocyanin
VDRFVVPLLLPIGVALTIAVIIALMSQIMLIVPEPVATPIALVVALFILIACTLVANTPKLPRSMIYALAGIPLLVLLIAGGASGAYRFNEAQQEAAAAADRGANAPATALAEVTTDNKFSRTTLNVPAGQEITLTQSNKGLNIHNWHVLSVKDAAGKDITTDLTQPGQNSKVTFTLNAPGTYKFQCDVHPTEMLGDLIVKATGG